MSSTCGPCADKTDDEIISIITGAVGFMLDGHKNILAFLRELKTRTGDPVACAKLQADISAYEQIIVLLENTEAVRATKERSKSAGASSASPREGAGKERGRGLHNPNESTPVLSTTAQRARTGVKGRADAAGQPRAGEGHPLNPGPGRRKRG